MLTSLAITILTILIVLYLDKTKISWVQKLLNWLPAILFAYIIPAIITHLFDLDFSDATIHNWSKSFIMPGAIILVMSALSFKQLNTIGFKPILVFVSGSFTVAVFPLILLAIIGLFSNNYYDLIITQAYWKGLVPIVGSWIGGSTSQLILKEVVECPEGLFLSILVMDNILVNIWTLIMFQTIKKSDWLNNKFGIQNEIPDFIPDNIDLAKQNKNSSIVTLFFCLLVVILAYLLISSFILKIIVLSFVGLIFGNFFPNWNHTIVLKAGGLFIITIMAILGLKLNFSQINLPLPIVYFSIIWLIMHYVVMTLVCYLFKIHMAWVPIGSMANVGGISTAPAVTKAYNEEWMPHAILLAILSMVSGTAWGFLTIWLFEYFY